MRASRSRRGVPNWRLASLIALAIAVVSWQAASSLGLTNESLYPSPAHVASAWASWLASGELTRDCLVSLERVGMGFGLAAVSAILLGVAAGSTRMLRQQLNPIVEVLRPIPPIAWVPLALLWLGIGTSAAVMIVFIGAFFPIFTSVLAGILAVDASKIDAARSLGAGRRQIILGVSVPAASQQIFVGLRTGLGMAWMSVIAAELVGVQFGVGNHIQEAEALLRSDQVIAGMATIGVLGACMVGLLAVLERLLIPWGASASSERLT